MSIPHTSDFILPVLQILGDAQVHERPALFREVVTRIGVSEADLQLRLAYTGRSVVRGRFEWTMQLLHAALLVERIGALGYLLTSRGADLLASEPSKVSWGQLSLRYPELQAWLDSARLEGNSASQPQSNAGAHG